MSPASLSRPAVLAATLWLILVSVAILSRPLMPVDETRYLAVAWEMWQRGDFLVPHLNGEPYSHKPPLLFWLIHLGWSVFGVNQWWPRLVAPVLGLANLFLTVRLARALWPETDAVAEAAPLVLIGTLFWALYTTLTMFDMVLTTCVLLGFLGLIRAWRTGAWAGFAVFGLGLGLGLLAKGPAILLHTLPAALLAPLWAPRLPGGRGWPAGWGRWYVGLLAAVVLGAAIGLAWAVPAGAAGGEAYRDAIFWGQSAGRLVNAFAHRRPFWWYAALLPVLLVPWVLWPALWRSAMALRGVDGGVRFCLAWVVPALIAFSAISGKQLHYLLPEVPALALMIAALAAAAGERGPTRRRDGLIPGLAGTALGLAMAVLPLLAPAGARLPPWFASLAPGWAVIAIAAGLWLAFWPGVGLVRRVAALAGMSVALIVAAHLIVAPALAKAYDLAAVSARLGAWQRQGVPLAHLGKYHGQFHFLGRLTEPIAVVDARSVEPWLRRHPGAKVVAYYRTLPKDPKPDFAQAYRGRFLVVWDGAVLLAHPGLLRPGR